MKLPTFNRRGMPVKWTFGKIVSVIILTLFFTFGWSRAGMGLGIYSMSLKDLLLQLGISLVFAFGMMYVFYSRRAGQGDLVK